MSEIERPTPDPTPEEVREAQALREALEGHGEHELAELAGALKFAHDPPEIDPALNETLVRAAIARAHRSGSRVVYVAFGAATALALAAAVALLVTRGGVERAPELALSRSTQSLFDAPFPRQGGTSARVDRIAEARARDYRANLFARMGVR
ncbi:MAG: hypothetical protein HY898_10890 [Deltaproteobacteria bacterium]|nr:hypothetical protein [Deltaproteobacteria bacterium]